MHCKFCGSKRKRNLRVSFDDGYLQEYTCLRCLLNPSPNYRYRSKDEIVTTHESRLSERRRILREKGLRTYQHVMKMFTPKQ